MAVCRKWSWTVGLAFAAFLSGCPAPDPSPTPAPVVRSGAATVKSIGVDGDQPGLSMVTGVGKFNGFDAEFAQWLINRNKWNARPFVVPSRDREAVIQEDPAGETIVISSYSITDERRKLVGMAGPYLRTRQGVLVRAGENRVGSTNDLQELTVCTVTGTTSEKQLREQGITRLTLVDGFGECVELLKSRQVDAVSTDLLILYGFAKVENGAVEVVPKLSFGNFEEYGIGFRRGDMAMCERLTESIKDFIDSGTWRTYYRNHDFPPELEDDSRPDPNNLDPC
ncbi:transporter substrate-binding domain-containing protein [Micromonospora carbonacea]|uniref:Glutamate transport system substrate-binding protein n=1 Tax=Micromonospora carbonacea TaxID=47853 RepID=A0A1C4WH60_9ACTN|nr:transporter substrate-binding domain-containing protein [Micromonospora carbonacea]SCE95547.1 glutamate transport system substrate-binding protein [Micromonospora carbonacea]